MPTHTTSAGKTIKIAEMNDYHLHNAIKKHGDGDPEKLAALRAEQERRGGPPKDAK
jgi:hypothetical protein